MCSQKNRGGTELLDPCQVVGIKYSGALVNKSYSLGTSFTIGGAGYCDGYLIECSKATRFQLAQSSGVSVLGIKGNVATVIVIANTGAKDISIDFDYLLITMLSVAGTLYTNTVTLS